MTQITVQYIRDIELGKAAIDEMLLKFGREVFKLRKGEDMESPYYYESYQLHSYAAGDVLELQYYWSRADDYITVAFPASYIEDPHWQVRERINIEQAKRAREQQEAEAEEARLARKEEKDRKLFEELKARFEPS